MEKKYKLAGIWNIVCAVLFALSYVVYTYFLESEYDIEGRILRFSSFLLLGFFSYVAVPFLFIGLVPLAIMFETPFVPYVPWLIVAIMLVTGIWLLLKRKHGRGTKVLLAVNLGFKGNGNLLIGFYVIFIRNPFSAETFLASVLAWVTLIFIFVSVAQDHKLIVRKRKKRAKEASWTDKKEAHNEK